MAPHNIHLRRITSNRDCGFTCLAMLRGESKNGVNLDCSDLDRAADFTQVYERHTAKFFKRSVKWVRTAVFEADKVYLVLANVSSFKNPKINKQLPIGRRFSGDHWFIYTNGTVYCPAIGKQPWSDYSGIILVLYYAYEYKNE